MFGWFFQHRATAQCDTRWVVLDVETSGLDSARDQLLSIGAVSLVQHGARWHVHPADSLHVALQQVRPSTHQNILVHGLGQAAQRAGEEPRLGLQRFFDYVHTSPVLAFHAAFDRAFVARAARAHGCKMPDNPWLDLAQLVPVLEPKAGLKSLDEWLRHYDIPVSARHNAAADAYLTALLALRALAQARTLECQRFDELQRLARQGQWLRA